MCRQIFRIVFFTLLVPIVFSSCVKSKPDLLPIRRAGGQGSEGYCNKDDQGRLVVKVENQGAAASSASGKVTVDFPGGPAVKSLPGIPAGGTVEVLFDIPVGCHDSDCNFKITVDSDNAIDESDEGNNSADGICIG